VHAPGSERPGSEGPDLAIVGAARSGTSYLAAHLAAHPQIDPGCVKEPNYFSRSYDRGPRWYDGLFSERKHGLRRMDASTSYTYPQFPEALTRLANDSPDAYVVYVVRDPLARAVSHYLYYRHYFRREEAVTFGAAVRARSFYGDVSDYSVWVPRLRAAFETARLLVVPFEVLTQSSSQVVAATCGGLGIGGANLKVSEPKARAHRNDVVEFRSDLVLWAARRIRHNRAYPRIRVAVGPQRVRRLRALLTRPVVLPTVAEALSSCEEDQLDELRALETRARVVVREHLVVQDRRLGLEWARHWARSVSLTELRTRNGSR